MRRSVGARGSAGGCKVRLPPSPKVAWLRLASLAGGGGGGGGGPRIPTVPSVALCEYYNFCYYYLFSVILIALLKGKCFFVCLLFLHHGSRKRRNRTISVCCFLVFCSRYFIFSVSPSPNFRASLSDARERPAGRAIRHEGRARKDSDVLRGAAALHLLRCQDEEEHENSRQSIKSRVFAISRTNAAVTD